MHIVCYTGGTCGDLLSAMIDPTHARQKNNMILHHAQRQRLKKPHQFQNDNEKTCYINQISKLYNSIPSHDLDYHVRNKHCFIAVAVCEFETALWAATRFRALHGTHVWQEMQRACGAVDTRCYAKTLMDFSHMIRYQTDNIIELERILDGKAIEDLNQYVSHELDSVLYQNWLQSQ